MVRAGRIPPTWRGAGTFHFFEKVGNTMATRTRSKTAKKKAPRRRAATKKKAAARKRNGARRNPNVIPLTEEQQQMLRQHDQKLSWLKNKLADATVQAERDARQYAAAEKQHKETRVETVDAIGQAQGLFVKVARDIAAAHGVDLSAEPDWQLNLKLMELRRPE
jgi:hypothetical protein